MVVHYDKSSESHLKNECSLLFELIDINNVRDCFLIMLSGHISQRFLEYTGLVSPISLPVQAKIAITRVSP